MQKNTTPVDSSDELKPKTDISPSPCFEDLKKPSRPSGEKPDEQGKQFYPGMDSGPPLITLPLLSRAIENRTGIDSDEAKRDAGFVLDLFGFEDRIVDNVLEPADRQMFYILEEEGIVETEREVNTLYDGREWRTHYWKLKKDKILEYSGKDFEKSYPGKGLQKRRQEGNGESEIYESLWKELDREKNQMAFRYGKQPFNIYNSGNIDKEITEKQT